jgi:hypothetical protein
LEAEVVRSYDLDREFAVPAPLPTHLVEPKTP